MEPRVSILTQVYGQPKLLKFFTDALRGWPSELAREAELVVIDDCGSPGVHPSEVAGLDPMGVQLLRHTEDVPWAQPCCRNLAAAHALGEVMILVDPDMVIPPEKAQAFMDAATSLKKGEVTRFCLLEMNHPDKTKRGKVNTSSPNAWIIHRSDFTKAGGYNEQFAGHKGWSDVELLHVLESGFKVRQNEKLTVNFYRRSGELPDAHVGSLDREVKTNHTAHAANREVVRRKFKGNWFAWSQQTQRKARKIPFEKLI